jgi:hypothetical protein
VVGSVFGRQSRAPKERVDFSFAQLDRHTPQAVFPSYAVATHTAGSRRTKWLFCARYRHGDSWTLSHPSCASSRAPSPRTDNIKASLR